MPTTKNLPSLQVEKRLEEKEKEEEHYIEMELSPNKNSSASSSPQSTREFEFQIMSLTLSDKESNTFPAAADELFYKGKLLPLLLPSRRQMLQNLTPAFDFTEMPFRQDHNYHSMPSTHTLNTPLDSCNISPSESCRVSCELNPDDYFFEWSTELSSFVNNNSNNNNNNHLLSKKKLPWSKRFKLIKKLKASRAYLKSLFNKSGCSDVSSGKANCYAGQSFVEIANESLKIANKKKTTIATIIKNGVEDDDSNNDNNVRRMSFSSKIKRHYPVKCLSSSSSSSSSSFSINNSNGFFHELSLRRSSSATEIEGSIEAAIDHCKKSCRVFDSTNSSTESGNCSFSVSRDIEDQKRPGVCM